MTRRIQVLIALLGALLVCGLALAQNPVVTVDKKAHPNLAQAQIHIMQANHYLEVAQKVNRYDMQGHAEKARQLLDEADKEVKAAAEAANAAAAAGETEGQTLALRSEPYPAR